MRLQFVPSSSLLSDTQTHSKSHRLAAENFLHDSPAHFHCVFLCEVVGCKDLTFCGSEKFALEKASNIRDKRDQVTDLRRTSLLSAVINLETAAKAASIWPASHKLLNVRRRWIGLSLSSSILVKISMPSLFLSKISAPLQCMERSESLFSKIHYTMISKSVEFLSKNGTDHKLQHCLASTYSSIHALRYCVHASAFFEASITVKCVFVMIT